MGNLTRIITVKAPNYEVPILYPIMNEALPSNIPGGYYPFTQSTLWGDPQADPVRRDTNAILRVVTPVAYFVNEFGMDAVYSSGDKPGSGMDLNALSIDSYSDLEVIQKAHLLAVPKELKIRANSYSYKLPDNLSNYASTLYMDYDFLNHPSFPKTSKAIVYIIDTSSWRDESESLLNTDTVFAVLALRNPGDNVVLDPDKPWFKWAIREYWDTGDPNINPVVGIDNNRYFNDNISYITDNVNSGNPQDNPQDKERPIGSTFKLSDTSENKLTIGYPYAPISSGENGNKNGSYENTTAYDRVRIGLCLINFNQLTGNIECNFSIEVDKTISEEPLKLLVTCGVGENEISIAGDVSGSELDDIPVTINTGVRYNYSYTIPITPLQPFRGLFLYLLDQDLGTIAMFEPSNNDIISAILLNGINPTTGEEDSSYQYYDNKAVNEGYDGNGNRFDTSDDYNSSTMTKYGTNDTVRKILLKNLSIKFMGTKEDIKYTVSL